MSASQRGVTSNPVSPDLGATSKGLGHEATETGFAYAPVSQAHGHNHNCSMSCLLHCSVDQFCTTPGGF